jgi:ectoine hydroxylase-related dioxygenase (phytanoyl-CoA dioxygenase family)
MTALLLMLAPMIPIRAAARHEWKACSMQILFFLSYTVEILLAASRQVLGGPLKLSCFHARSLHPHCEAGELHIDFRSDEEPFPLVYFIYMIDKFSQENGATRFLRGSQHCKDRPSKEELSRQSVPVCAPAGSVIVLDSRIWHAHEANSSSLPRRSVQGSFIPPSQPSATEFDIPTFPMSASVS